jgi:SAM-dependent methyltransferase
MTGNPIALAKLGLSNMPGVRKWWVENVEERPTDADDLERLAQVNVNAAVPVEIAAGDHTRGAATVQRRGNGEPAEAAPVNKRFLKEGHHRQYGRPWAMGRYLFDFVVGSGLRPEHRLLDFGCGALRLGIWVIPYLEPGNYFGVDSHLVSLEAAATYEIPLHGLEQKRPRLLWNDDFAFTHFESTFDYVVDISSSSRVKDPKRRRRVFASFAEVLTPGGRLLTVPRPDLSEQELAELGLNPVRSEVIQRCELLEGHEDSFRPYNVWNELVRE